MSVLFCQLGHRHLGYPRQAYDGTLGHALDQQLFYLGVMGSTRWCCGLEVPLIGAAVHWYFW
ncbi:hypothetical protein [Hymenobacter sp.]|uniref:hypothetical protein n=1 Tax=Hymenobacter sp. TaxID=1898978 RepID=UPI002ED8B1AE